MKQSVFAIVGLAVIVLAMPIDSNQQTASSGSTGQYEIAVQELESIIARSEDLQDLRKYVAVRSKAASLLWSRNSAAAAEMFTALWSTIEKREASEQEKESARMDLLEHLFPKDRKLAIQLSRSVAASESAISSIQDITGNTPEARRLAFLSHRIAEDNVTVAAAILEAGLEQTTAPSVPLVLNRIRLTNPLLANYVASGALDRFQTQQATKAVFGMVAISGYLFPLTPNPVITPESRESDEMLRQQFMTSAYSVLKRSLSESNEDLKKNQGLSPAALDLRQVNQTLLASILAAMSQRYSQERFVELNTLALGLQKQMLPDVMSLIALQVASVRGLIGLLEEAETSDADIISAMAREDFEKAALLINSLRDEARKKDWLGVLYRAQATEYLKQGDLQSALSASKKIEKPEFSIPIALEVTRLAAKKKDDITAALATQQLSKIVANLSGGLQAKTMLSNCAAIAPLLRPQAFSMLESSVEKINALSELKSSSTSKVSYTGSNYWNDPDNFLNASSFARAFGAIGSTGMQDALLTAARLRDNSLQMMARLAVIDKALQRGPDKRPASKSSPPAKPR